MAAAAIRSLWVLRTGYEDGPPELLVAWDQWSIEHNYEGWQAACAQALAEVGDDVAAHRLIDISVDADALQDAFSVAHIPGTLAAAEGCS